MQSSTPYSAERRRKEEGLGRRTEEEIASGKEGETYKGQARREREDGF